MIVTPLLAMFRGFAGSFGSAIGGGIFARVLQSNLEKGFADRGMTGRGSLVRRLLGSPKLVQSLTGEERIVAQEGYVAATQALFLAGTVLSLVMTLAQAGTGWRGPIEKEEEVEDGHAAEAAVHR